MADVTSSGLCRRFFGYARNSRLELGACPTTISFQPMRSA